jgi:chemotaxis protein histidine kinase CheA
VPRPAIIAQEKPLQQTFSVPKPAPENSPDNSPAEVAKTVAAVEEPGTSPNPDTTSAEGIGLRALQTANRMASAEAAEAAQQRTLALEKQRQAEQAAAQQAQQIAETQAAELAARQAREAAATAAVQAAARKAEQELEARQLADQAARQQALALERQRQAEQATEKLAQQQAQQLAERQATELAAQQAREAASAQARAAAASAAQDAAGQAATGGKNIDSAGQEGIRQASNPAGSQIAAGTSNSPSRGNARQGADAAPSPGVGSGKGTEAAPAGGGKLASGQGATGAGQGPPGGASGESRVGEGSGAQAGQKQGDGAAVGKAAGSSPAPSQPAKAPEPAHKTEARAVVPVKSPLADDICHQKATGWYKPDVQVDLYATVWRHTVSWEGDFDLLQDAKTGSYENPVVSVTIRSDGNVENVTFNKSSGRPEIDGAVRRVIHSLAPYSPFSRELSVDCQVVEFPSVWTFNRALRVTWRGQ